MSEEASKGFQEARKEQYDRNEARNIWYHVHQHRGSHVASIRWPFELFQNALDAGPRPGRSSVAIGISHQDSGLIFEHDGAPFSYDDLAALLSGGSSKDLQSATTTGRFGIGYLVTHILSERVHLKGLLKVPTGTEQFDLVLDRSGDEQAILNNIHLCGESIRAAKAITDTEITPSAIFEYPIQDAIAIDAGIAALRKALPYLYASRPNLGRVVIEREGGTREVWAPGELIGEAIEDGWLEYRSLQVHQQGNALPEIRIYRFVTKQKASSSALVLVERTESGWKAIRPDQDAPRVYREYPLSGSGFLPINLVLDGKFDPDEQRRAPKMGEEDKKLLIEALAAGVLAVKYAFAAKWENGHLLARASNPTTAFNPSDVGEKQWWTEQLSVFAQALARLPIVKCTAGDLPAVTDADEGQFADFIIPRLWPASTEDETTVERMWPVVAACTELDPPTEELASDWTEIAEGWLRAEEPYSCPGIRRTSGAYTGQPGTQPRKELRVRQEKMANLAGHLWNVWTQI